MAAEVPEIRAFHDTGRTRDFLYANVVDAFKSAQASDGNNKIMIDKVRLAGPTDFPLSRQKKAIVAGRSVNTPLKGRIRLINEDSNQVLDEKDMTLMNVPYYTDRGTVVRKGLDYSVVSQSRLKPGPYTRIKKSGEYETQFNIKSGTGAPFRLWMEPATGIFRVNIRQSNIPAYPLFKLMGISDEQMKREWGEDLYKANVNKTDNKAVDKLYDRVVFKSLRKADALPGEKEMAVRESLAKAEMDPWVVQKNLGLDNTANVTPEVLMRTTGKLLNVGRGDETTDDRDAPAFSNILSVEDFIPERVSKDAGNLLKTALWKAKRSGNLEHVRPGYFNSYVDGFINNSGLAQPGEETNMLSAIEQQYRITKMGTGGLPSEEAVTEEARDVNPGQAGFIDTVAGPECYDEITEVFTSEGWKYWKNVDKNDRFLVEVDGVQLFSKAERLIAEDYEGDMYEFANSVINQCVTPNHNVVCVIDGGIKPAPAEIHAEWIYNKLASGEIKNVEVCSMVKMFDYNVPEAEVVGYGFMYDGFYKIMTGGVDRRAAMADEFDEGYDKAVAEAGEYDYDVLAKQWLIYQMGLGRCLRPSGNYSTVAANCFEDVAEYHDLRKGNVVKIKYKGKVYCATVPGGRLYVRRGTRCAGVWSGNSSRIGIDVRAAYKTFKGRDNQLYAEFDDVASGKRVLRKPEELLSSTIAFPGEDLSSPDNIVKVIRNGKLVTARAGDVDYAIPSMAHMLNPANTLVPMPTGFMAGRLFYGSKYAAQTMPLAEGETPLVKTKVPGKDMSFGQYFGKKIASLTAPAAGTITRVTDNNVVIKDSKGKTYYVDTVKDFPFNRLTGSSYYPVVKAGDKVKAGDMVAHSNFTDSNGEFNSGRNLRVVINPGKGKGYEDSYIISRSAAEKLKSERLYGFDEENRFGKKISRKMYISAFPNKYNNRQLDKLGDSGVIKKGAVVEKGDPIILSTGPKVLSAENAKLGKLHKVLRNTFRDESTVWDHDYNGIVTDVHHDSRGARVFVKAQVPVQKGDKLCYHPDTEVLTENGWKKMVEITVYDKIATLANDSELIYMNPEAIHIRNYNGNLYNLKTTQVELMVTDYHKLYAKPRYGEHKGSYALIAAKDLYGKRYRLKKDAEWFGGDLHRITLPALKDRPFGQGAAGVHDIPGITVDTDDLLKFLGIYIADGWCSRIDKDRWRIDLAAKKKRKVDFITKLFKRLGIATVKIKNGFSINNLVLSKWLLSQNVGRAATKKRVPRWIFNLSKRQILLFLEAVSSGDGSVTDSSWHYFTSSKQLADDIQQLVLHAGLAANVNTDTNKIGEVMSYNADGHPIIKRGPSYAVSIYQKKLYPQINHGHSKKQKGQLEQWIFYSGEVICPEMPEHHVIYVRLNGKAVWSGNCNAFSTKGVVGHIGEGGANDGEAATIKVEEVRADSDMPINAATGEPYEVVFNPMTVLSRVAPNQITEAALGKVALKRGEPYLLDAIPPKEGWDKFVANELEKYGVPDKVDVVDPKTGRVIKNQGDGIMYMSVFHHLAEKKLCLTGDTEVFTTDSWKPIGELTVDDIILTLNRETGVLAFRKISKMRSYRIDGEPLYRVIDDVQDLEGTGDHRFVGADLEVKTGSELYEDYIGYRPAVVG